MPNLVSEPIEQYALRMTTPEPPALARLNRETYLKTSNPDMLSGHLQGSFLEMICRMIAPERILEIGTFTGYSALWLARGLKEGGRLHTIDINEELTDMCLKYWEEGGVADCIELHVGKAADVIPGLDGPFDLVFIDADKIGYPDYFDLVIDKVRAGGWIIADNVLFHGEVILPEPAQSKNARAMHAFNEKISADDRVEQLLVPLRDGLLIMRKN
jgi:predicted O-methyltransferase YrrM